MREEQIFHEVLEQAAEKRAAFLAAACGADVELRQRVEVLLQAQANPGSFLQVRLFLTVRACRSSRHTPSDRVDLNPELPAPGVDQVGQQVTRVLARDGTLLAEIFTERRTEVSLLKLDSSASTTINGNCVCLVLRGAGTAGDAPLRKLTAVHLARGETLTVTASEETEIVQLGLPNLAGVTMGIPEELTAEAAE
jgi:AcrR family transcriptional regulator